MKIRLIPPRVFSTLLIGFALLAGGCGNSAQEKTYTEALKKEEPFTAEKAPAVIAEYRRVIAMEPGSTWAKKAQERITAVEARVKAEEQHKEIFQQHGVD